MNVLRHIGEVQSAAIAHDLLFEDQRRERLSMPFADRWSYPDKMPIAGLRYELDLGSVLGFTESQQLALADKCREVLNEVGRICQGEWHWHTSERTINDLVKASQFSNKMSTGDPNELFSVPVDQRKFLYINFASRDDAMLVRMTLDLEKVQDVNSRGLPQDT